MIVISIVVSINRFLLSILILIECRQLDDRHVDSKLLIPPVIMHDHVVRHLHDIMESLLKRLLQREQLAFVRTRVIHLALAGRGTNHIRMDTHGEAQGVACFLHVVAPVATLFLIAVNQVVDTHHTLFLTLRRSVVRCHPGLTRILWLRAELSDPLAFQFDTFRPFRLISDILLLADVIPIRAVHLHLDTGSTGILDHEPFTDADQAIDIIPGVPIDRRKVRHRIIAIARCREEAEDGKLTLRALTHTILQITQRVDFIQQRDSLDGLRTTLAEVAHQHVFDTTKAVAFRETAVAGVTHADLHDLRVIAAQVDHHDREVVILHVGGHPEPLKVPAFSPVSRSRNRRPCP